MEQICYEVFFGLVNAYINVYIRHGLMSEVSVGVASVASTD